MTLQDAMTSMVTRAQALREVRKHGACVDEFLAACGDRAAYSGRAVLRWLGY